MATFHQSDIRAGTGASAAAIDEGLRSHMNKVYGLMSGALLMTFAIAFFVSQSAELQALLLLPSPLFYVAAFGPLAFVMIASFGFQRLNVGVINALFWGYAALTGVSLSVIFIMFASSEIIMGLAMTSVAFLGLSLTGYLTKRDLGPIGQVATMMMWGLLAIAIISWFTGGLGAMGFKLYNIAILGVFAILTAVSTQEVKNTYLEAAYHGGPEAEMFLQKAAILGALNLYISFIAMFRSIMYLFMGGDD